MKLNDIPKICIALVLFSVGVTLTACSRGGSNNAEVIVESRAVVIVGGTPITKDDVNYARKKFFGERFVDARAERNVIESLISSRAISNKAKSSLPNEVLLEIDIAVAAYKEELLIKYFIESSDVSIPVSAAEVDEYYHNHLESFGASDKKIVEVAKAEFSKENRLPILESMNKIQNGDWSSKYSGVHSFQTFASTLNGDLGVQINSLKLGESTGVIVNGSEAYIARLKSVEHIPAKPLAEVSREIRKRLAARKISEKIRELSRQARSEVEVVWLSE